MPIYEYQCVACGAVRDIKHGFKEPMNEPCATCGAALKRLFNPASIVFKGSGFYVTDSRKASAPAGEKSGSEKPADGKPDSKPDSKPDAKTDGKSDGKPASKPESASKSASGGKSDAAA